MKAEKIRIRLKASYVLIPKLITPIIDAGEVIEVEIYLSGYGQVAANKLRITISSKQLVNPEVPGTIESSIGIETDKATGKHYPITGKSYMQSGKGSHRLDEIGVTIGVIEAYFHDTSGEHTPGLLNQIFAERMYDDVAPFVLKINTKKKVPKGDYTIDMAFTYSDGQEMATDQKAVTVHVTDFVEKHSMLISLAAIIGTIVTVAGFVLPFILSSLTSGSPASPTNATANGG